MTQTATVPTGRATAEDRFEGIGPYTREHLRLVAAPTSATQNAPAAPPKQAAASPPITLTETEQLDQRAYVSARWCDIGISLIVLISGAAALFRLILTGQP